ncbi:MAG: universal stress protein [Bacteroidales bacterium]|nr:universal stress protein [Bacteroidales bacterium]
MNVQKILVPIDFSEVTKVVIETAAYLASKSNMSIVLLHIEKTKSNLDFSAKVKAIVNDSMNNWPVQYELLLRQGSIFDEITKTAADDQFKFMVIGSHGFKGLREKVFGADILKLLKSVQIPVFTVQENYTLPESGINSILFPVGSHDSFINQIKSTIEFSKIFDAIVHLYSVEKPGMQWSEEIKTNMKIAQSEFEKHQISFKNVKEVQSTFSVGFAKQIMDYAVRANISVLTVMANSAKEHFYFADSDKVTMLTNQAGIPVISSNEKTLI